MIYLFDTNVISETTKTTPNQKLIEWIMKIDMQDIAISVLTLGEIRKGIEKLQDDSRKQQITYWLETDLIKQFKGRIITIDEKVSDKWGYITSYSDVPAIDGLIASSCLVHNLKLVTRNVKDFIKIAGLEIINPWEL